MTEKRKFLYKNLFLVSSILWAGNTVEYFSKQTEKLIVLYFLPRWDKQDNFFEIYKKGILYKKKNLFSPKNIFFQYPVLYFNFLYLIIKFFKKSEHFFVISYHPFPFILKRFINYFRPFDIVFWIMDYIPSGTYTQKLFQFFVSRYHDFSKFNIYLSNRLNRIMNYEKKKINFQQTVMLGVRNPVHSFKKHPDSSVRLCYNGVIKTSHNIPLLFELIKNDHNLSLKLLGKCNKNLYDYYLSLMKKYGISKRVYFPNKYFTYRELVFEAKNCHIGVALYSNEKNNSHYYADPGKIKIYTELNLPVIITNVAEISRFIRHFHAGEVVGTNFDAVFKAIMKIKKNYSFYLSGVKHFRDYFYFVNYYRKKFYFLEQKI